MTMPADTEPYKPYKTCSYLFLISFLATLIASIVGVLIVMAFQFPFSLLMIFAPWLVVVLVWNGAVWAGPVTFGLLPITAFLGHRYPRTLYFVLPVLGLFGGIMTMKFWAALPSISPEIANGAKLFLLMMPGKQDEPMLVAGAVGGLTAGLFFSSAALEMRR